MNASREERPHDAAPIDVLLALRRHPVGVTRNNGVEPEIAHVDGISVVDPQDVDERAFTLQYLPQMYELLLRIVFDEVVAMTIKADDAKVLVGLSYNAAGHFVDGAVAAAGDEANGLVGMSLAIGLDVLCGIAGGLRDIYIRGVATLF